MIKICITDHPNSNLTIYTNNLILMIPWGTTWWRHHECVGAHFFGKRWFLYSILQYGLKAGCWVKLSSISSKELHIDMYIFLSDQWISNQIQPIIKIWHDMVLLLGFETICQFDEGCSPLISFKWRSAHY